MSKVSVCFFDGIDDYFILSSASSVFDQITGAMSEFIWIKPDINSNGQGNFIAKYGGNSSEQTHLFMQISNNRFQVYLKTGGALHTPASADNLFPYGVWSFVGFTYNGSNIQLYVDGVAVGSPSVATGNVDIGSNQLSVGLRYDDGAISYPFYGLMDDIRIYNAAIPTSQIKEQYYAGLNNLLANRGITGEEYQQRISGLENKTASE